MINTNNNLQFKYCSSLIKTKIAYFVNFYHRNFTENCQYFFFFLSRNAFNQNFIVDVDNKKLDKRQKYV